MPKGNFKSKVRSFSSGVVRSVDFTGAGRMSRHLDDSRSQHGEVAAIKSDVVRIGGDIQRAFKELVKTLK